MNKIEPLELTRKQKKVAVAQDVINQILSNGYSVLRSNGYVSPRDWSMRMAVSLSGPVDKQEVGEIAKTCDVCAVGSLLLSRIRMFNTLSFKDLGAQNRTNPTATIGTFRGCGISPCINGLKGIFTERELKQIEIAFEMLGGARCITTQFGKDFDDDDDRLLAIMQNIVDHDGVFKPKVRYIVRWN